MQGDLVLVGRSTGFGEENDIYVWEYEFVPKNIDQIQHIFIRRLEAS